MSISTFLKSAGHRPVKEWLICPACCAVSPPIVKAIHSFALKHAWIAAALLLCFATVAHAEDHRVYFGILHSHTGYSDGSGLPPEAYKRAKVKGRCDFFAITEHNHGINLKPKDAPASQIIAKSPSNYNGGAKSLVQAAKDATSSTFVALYGQEFSTISSGNHANVFDVPNVIRVRAGRYDDLVDWIRTSANFDSSGNPAIVQLNHPSGEERNKGHEYGADKFGSETEWINELGQLACLIEIANGPGLSKTDKRTVPASFQSHYFHYLSLGFRLAPTANHDNHYKTWGTLTTARTGIIAKELTKRALLEAIRARHVYATTDNNLEIIARVDGTLTGEVVTFPSAGHRAKISVMIKDRDEPDATYDIMIHSGIAGSRESAKRVSTFEGTHGNHTYDLDEVVVETKGQYLFLIIKQVGPDGSRDTAWTAPVWFGMTGPLATTATGSPASHPESAQLARTQRSESVGSNSVGVSITAVLSSSAESSN